MADIEYISKSPEETIQFGQKIGQQLKGGEVFALVGDLGTGKTHFIKGIALGAGVENQWGLINSPTFVLVNEYEGRLKVYHIDAYRIEKLSDFQQIGFEDFIDPANVILIEWADKVRDALYGIDLIEINFSHEGPDSRKIKISNAPGYLPE